MFTLSQKPSYTWPVVYETPKGDGKFDRYTFEAEFKRLPQERLDDMMKKVGDGTLTDDDLIDEVLLGWSGIQKTDGEPLEFNETNRRILLNHQGMRSAFVVAYLKSLGGAPRKN